MLKAPAVYRLSTRRNILLLRSVCVFVDRLVLLERCFQCPHKVLWPRLRRIRHRFSRRESHELTFGADLGAR